MPSKYVLATMTKTTPNHWQLFALDPDVATSGVSYCPLPESHGLSSIQKLATLAPKSPVAACDSNKIMPNAKP